MAGNPNTADTQRNALALQILHLALAQNSPGKAKDTAGVAAKPGRRLPRRSPRRAAEVLLSKRGGLSVGVPGEQPPPAGSPRKRPSRAAAAMLKAEAAEASRSVVVLLDNQTPHRFELEAAAAEVRPAPSLDPFHLRRTFRAGRCWRQSDRSHGSSGCQGKGVFAFTSAGTANKFEASEPFDAPSLRGKTAAELRELLKEQRSGLSAEHLAELSQPELGRCVARNSNSTCLPRCFVGAGVLTLGVRVAQGSHRRGRRRQARPAAGAGGGQPQPRGRLRVRVRCHRKEHPRTSSLFGCSARKTPHCWRSNNPTIQRSCTDCTVGVCVRKFDRGGLPAGRSGWHRRPRHRSATAAPPRPSQRWSSPSTYRFAAAPGHAAILLLTATWRHAFVPCSHRTLVVALG